MTAPLTYRGEVIGAAQLVKEAPGIVLLTVHPQFTHLFPAMTALSIQIGTV